MLGMAVPSGRATARPGATRSLALPGPVRRATCSSSAAARPVRRPRYWLAEPGIDVLVVEKKHFPREKTCGDGLTPRSVRQLYDMGLADDLAPYHRFAGLRANAFGRELDPALARSTATIPRTATSSRAPSSTRWSPHRAEKAGAVVWQGAEAVAASARLTGRRASRRCPAAAGGGASSPTGTTGPRPRSARRYVVVADGATRASGGRSAQRATGRLPTRHGAPRLLRVAAPRRAVHRVAPRHPRRRRQRRARLRLDLPARRRPGERRHRPALDLRPLEGRQHHQADGGLRRPGAGIVVPRRRDRAAARRPAAGCPMGLSVGPRVGPDYLARRRRRRHRSTPSTARASPTATRPGGSLPPPSRTRSQPRDPRLLGRYEQALEDTYGLYYRVARAFITVISRPG